VCGGRRLFNKSYSLDQCVCNKCKKAFHPCDLQLLSCAVIAVGIYLTVEKVQFVSWTMGTELVAASCYLVLAAASIIFLISFLGCFGSLFKNRTILLIVRFVFAGNIYAEHPLFVGIVSLPLPFLFPHFPFPSPSHPRPLEIGPLLLPSLPFHSLLSSLPHPLPSFPLEVGH